MLKRHYHTEIDGISIEVTRKKVKNLNIRIYPPDGQIRVSAPYYYTQKDIHQLIAARSSWIKRKQAAMLKAAPEVKMQIISGENHPFQGKLHRLQIIEKVGKPEVNLGNDSILIMKIPRQTNREQRLAILYTWYRKQQQSMIPPLIAKWEPRLGVKVTEWRIRRMKTRWGTCNTKAHRIWLNLELVKKSPECLDYVILHEMVHLLERGHNKRFYAFLDRFMPDWRDYRAELKQTPLASDYWAYS